MDLALAAALAAVVAVALDVRVRRLARREPTGDVAVHLGRRAGRLVAPALAAVVVVPLAQDGDSLRTVAAAVLVPTLVVASVVDAHVRRIPDVVTRPASLAGLAVCAGVCVRDGSPRAALVAAAVAAVALGLAAGWPAALGAGDAKLIVALALLATAWGPSAVVPASALGLVLSGAASAAILVARRLMAGGAPHGPVAAGPFIAVGAVAALHMIAA